MNRTRKNLATSLMGAYLILLWNLGPSIHALDLFGLHSSSCCHCCSDTHDIKSPQLTWSNLDSQLTNCRFCEFFSQLNLSEPQVFLPIERPSAVELVSVNAVTQPSAMLVLSKARGPPNNLFEFV